MKIAGIDFRETDSKVWLLSRPVPGRAALDAAILRTLLIEAGYSSFAQDEAAIEKAAGMCNSQTTPFQLQVAQRLDAVISVDVAADEMSATLRLTAAQGGVNAKEQDVMQALTQVGVLFGIDHLAIARICQAAQSTEQTVALGTPPRDGVDARFDALVPKIVDRAPKLDSEGHVDYREHGVVLVVHAGTPLMRRFSATAGVDGQTIRGQVLSARNGRDAAFSGKLVGVEISQGDPDLLVATISGQPVLATASVNVEPILRVRDVNMATGNVHFDGTVQVDGEVVQGMKVDASGDIVINGLVDGGHLNAGGNITVRGGLIGRGSLHAAGFVRVRFAEGSSMFAGTVLAVSDMVIDCHLESTQQILIGTESPQRGRVVGGSATAGNLLRVPLLGTPKSSLAKVSLGANTALDAKLAETIEQIEAAESGDAKLEKLVKHLTAIGDPKHLLDKVKASRQHALKQWGKLLAEKADIENEITKARSARLEVTVGVQGAVDLSICKVHARLHREFDAGSFSLTDDNKIIYSPADGSQPEPVT